MSMLIISLRLVLNEGKKYVYIHADHHLKACSKWR